MNIFDYKSYIDVDFSILESKLKEISNEIYSLTSNFKKGGYIAIPVSFNSTAQVSNFFNLNFNVSLKSTSVQVLEGLLVMHPELENVVKDICNIRPLLRRKSSISKFISDYKDSPVTRIDFGFKKGDNSERITTTPSVNTIPNPFRDSVIPSEGNKFIFLDFKSAELALLIYLSKDEYLWKVYCETDILSYMAEKINLSREDTKTLVYAFIYGSSYEGISTSLNIPLNKANQVFDLFRKEFPSLVNYSKSYLKESRNIGKAFTVYYTSKPLPADGSSDRVSFNYHIQSSFALWLAEGVKNIISYCKDIRFVTSVFDSLLLEVPQTISDSECIELIKSYLESSTLPGFIPRFKYASSVNSWGECEKNMK